MTFVKKFEKFDISINYDGITFYPKCDLGKEASFLPERVIQHKKGDHIKREIKCTLTFGYETEEGKKFKLACAEFEKKIGPYQKLTDKDEHHDFYHQDELDKHSEHVHLKFSRMLTTENLSTLLDILISQGFITNENKMDFLADYDDRMCASRAELSALLSENKISWDKFAEKQMADMRTIIQFIRLCKDNDKLVNLHHYLSTERFEYLRRMPYPLPQEIKWQGTDKNGKVVKSTEVWATIEKNISFQMAHNIKAAITEFNHYVGEEYANQLSQHPFFAIKRKQTAAGKINKMVDSFSRGEGDEFERRYKCTKNA